MVPKYLLLALVVGVVALTAPSDAWGYNPPEKEQPTPIPKPVGPKLPPTGHKPPTLADEKKPPMPKPPGGGGHKPPGGGGGHKPATLFDAKDGDGHMPEPKPKPHEKPPVHMNPGGPYKPPYMNPGGPYKPPYHKPPSTG